MKRVLITGATGTVGREVVRALLAQGDVHVRVAVRGDADFPPEVERARFDYEDSETYAPALRDVDAFFFVSPLVEDQVAPARAFLAAARAAGVSHCVRLSSRATGWDEVSALRLWHREVEDAVRASGMTWTLLRPCSFMQNVLGTPLGLVRARGVFSIPLGVGRIPFVDARDLGEVAALCLTDPAAHHGATYVLTGREALSGEDIATALGEARGAPVRYVPTAPDVAREAARTHGVPMWLVESGLRVYARAEHGEEGEVDTTLERLLGRAPTRFGDFAARHASDLRAL